MPLTLGQIVGCVEVAVIDVVGIGVLTVLDVEGVVVVTGVKHPITLNWTVSFGYLLSLKEIEK